MVIKKLGCNKNKKHLFEQRRDCNQGHRFRWKPKFCADENKGRVNKGQNHESCSHLGPPCK